MGLIMGEQGSEYEVKVGDRTVLVGKKGIDIVKEYEEGGKVESPKETKKESSNDDDDDDEITAYCMATKTKNVKMHDVVVKKTSKGGYIAHGTDGKGHKMVSMLKKGKGERLFKQ